MPRLAGSVINRMAASMQVSAYRNKLKKKAMREVF